MNETFSLKTRRRKDHHRVEVGVVEEKVREIDTSAEREIKIFHGPFITFFYVFLINDLLASFKVFFSPS